MDKKSSKRSTKPTRPEIPPGRRLSLAWTDEWLELELDCPECPWGDRGSTCPRGTADKMAAHLVDAHRYTDAEAIQSMNRWYDEHPKTENCHPVFEEEL